MHIHVRTTAGLRAFLAIAHRRCGSIGGSGALSRPVSAQSRNMLSVLRISACVLAYAPRRHVCPRRLLAKLNPAHLTACFAALLFFSLAFLFWAAVRVASVAGAACPFAGPFCATSRSPAMLAVTRCARQRCSVDDQSVATWPAQMSRLHQTAAASITQSSGCCKHG